MPDATLADMDAAVWTAIGLLAATSLGSLFYLGARIDSLGARMDSRFDGVAGRLDALEGRMEARFAHVDQRFDTLEARLDAHLDRHAG
jgi:hypothetical protein